MAREVEAVDSEFPRVDVLGVAVAVAFGVFFTGDFTAAFKGISSSSSGKVGKSGGIVVHVT